jgi:hypothetical protein
MRTRIAIYFHTADHHYTCHKANCFCYKKRNNDDSHNGYWVILPSKISYEQFVKDVDTLKYPKNGLCKLCHPKL